MKVLWHMPTLRSRTCGLSKRALCLAREMATGGHEVTFIVRRDCTDVSSGRMDGIPVRLVEISSVAPLHWSLQGLARASMADLLVQQLDVPHDLFVSCQPEAITAYRDQHPKAPLLFVCGGTTLLHDQADVTRSQSRPAPARLAFGLDAFVKHRNEKLAFRAADAIVFDSESTRAAVIAKYEIAPDKCHAIYGGADPADFHPPSSEQRNAARSQIGLGQQERVIAWTGRLSAEKNVACLIEAVAKCRTHGIKVLIVGDGPERDSLQYLADDLQVADRVLFVGESNDVRQYLFAADVFAFPSVGESFGGSLAEAMSCGLPCIALRGNGRNVRNASTEILDNGSCGVLVDQNDPGQFAMAIDSLFGDAPLRQALGAAAVERANAMFTWKSAGKFFQDLAMRVVSSRKKSFAARKNAIPSARVSVESIFG